MGFLLLLKAELVRRLTTMRRYWFATLTGMIVGYGFLLGFILALISNRSGVAEKMAGNLESATTATQWALGLIIGMFAFGIVGMFTQGLMDMARTGHLEQVCMSPHGLITNFLAKTFVSSVMSIATSAIILTLIAWTVGGTLHADFGPTILLLTLTYFNLIGFGFMLGGLVLVFKQTGQIALLFRMGLMALAVAATNKIETWHKAVQVFAHILPITDAAICLKYVLIEGQRVPVPDQVTPMLNGLGTPLLDELGRTIMIPVMQYKSVYELPYFWFLLINCIVWTVIGIALFRFMENWSRKKGTLGAY